MNPARCKHEHEISAAIEKWEERYRILKEDDRELELPDSYKMTAIQGILCGEIQKSVEHREKEFQSYDELRSTVMKWAINKRIEKERNVRGDPMDCDAADKEDWSKMTEEEWNAAAAAWYEQEQATWNETAGEGKADDIDYTGYGKGFQPYAGGGIKGWKGDGKGFKGGFKGGKGYGKPWLPYKGGFKGGKGFEKGKGKGNETRMCYICGKSGHLARECPTKGNETRTCYKCGKTGHLARDCRSGIRAVDDAEDQEGATGAVCWMVEEESTEVNIAEKQSGGAGMSKGKSGLEPKWLKKTDKGQIIQFVLDSGSVRTIVPPEATRGMEMKKGKGYGGGFRVANGETIPNLGEVKLEGIGSSGNVKMTAQVAAVTKPLASAFEMTESGNLVILHRTGGIVKKLSKAAEEKVRDIVKSEAGPEIVLERKAGAFKFEVETKSGGRNDEEFQLPKKTSQVQDEE